MRRILFLILTITVVCGQIYAQKQFRGIGVTLINLSQNAITVNSQIPRFSEVAIVATKFSTNNTLQEFIVENSLKEVFGFKLVDTTVMYVESDDFSSCKNGANCRIRPAATGYYIQAGRFNVSKEAFTYVLASGLVSLLPINHPLPTTPSLDECVTCRGETFAAFMANCNLAMAGGGGDAGRRIKSYTCCGSPNAGGGYSGECDFVIW